MAALLNLGPSFAVLPKIDSSLIDRASCAVHHYAYRLRWRVQNGQTVLDRQSTLLSCMPFPSRGIRHPEPATEFEPKIADLQIAIKRIYETEASKPYRPNLTRTERKGLRKALQLKKTLRYTVGDKCGSFVVIPQSLDKLVTSNVLSDKKHIRSN